MRAQTRRNDALAPFLANVGGLHAEPPAFVRVRGLTPILFFNVDEEKYARTKARKQASALGHSMTNFIHPSREPYTRSVCRTCGLKVYRLLNLELAGPALNHYCLRQEAKPAERKEDGEATEHLSNHGRT